MKKLIGKCLLLTSLLVASWLFTVGGGNCQAATLTVTNNSSFDVRIALLQKITFLDDQTPRARQYKSYITREGPPVYIKEETPLVLDIDSGFYGIWLCNGKYCTYLTFYIKDLVSITAVDFNNKLTTDYIIEPWTQK